MYMQCTINQLFLLRNRTLLMFLSEMFARLWHISSPAFEKSRSLGVLVAGHDRYFFASLVSSGSVDSCVFHHIKGSCCLNRTFFSSYTSNSCVFEIVVAISFCFSFWTASSWLSQMESGRGWAGTGGIIGVSVDISSGSVTGLNCLASLDLCPSSFDLYCLASESCLNWGSR